ncbi:MULTISPECIES: class I SAM-dependent methyltransferase [Protofrankia]|uniref:S-adenosyl-L-methionine-dependent methyltransferase n=1 Tax=Protofrankia coriariae TaxID=1562887 RepID=A0ABR5EZV0_9ACTN|nr:MULTISPECIES: class I SAM-dependent methyltransferase [Protofrankia]KLL09918.1 methyltransferase [Protofrankia coriariae]ONH34120.1 methyltransferase [Protofrankia sp. BMG5.30]
MRRRPASRTAVLVCQGRAVADGRLAPGRFHDPTAIALLRDEERVPVDQVRAGAPPQGWGPRVEFEMVRAASEVMVARTVAIDEAVRSRLSPQLVILGAGLDDRAWRMPELAEVDVFEVDHQASQRDKRDRVGVLAPCARSLRFVTVDFSGDRLEDVLASAGHHRAVPTTWVWEGVVPYLTRAQVAATMAAVDHCSTPGSRLIVTYQSPSLSTAVGRVAAGAMTLVARQPRPWAAEPRRSSWTAAAMRALLTSHRFPVAADNDLFTVAAGLPVEVKQHRSLRSGRIAVADRPR